MIESSGQILTGRAAEDLIDVIEVKTGADGYHRTVYKALALPSTMPDDDSMTKGTWCVLANEGDDALFLGVAGDDTTPHANRKVAGAVVDAAHPVVELYQSHSFKEGDVLTFERNGMISVIAGDTVKEGDLLKLADEGTFQPADASSDSIFVGRAYESAEEGEVFRAYIHAL